MDSSTSSAALWSVIVAGMELSNLLCLHWSLGRITYYMGNNMGWPLLVGRTIFFFPQDLVGDRVEDTYSI